VPASPPGWWDGVQISPRVYRPRRPETTALYEVVRDNLETLYGAIGEGAIAVRIPKHARKELEAYLSCGLLCRGFARLRCQGCGESRLVAFSCFSCKGRGYAERRNMHRRTPYEEALLLSCRERLRISVSRGARRSMRRLAEKSRGAAGVA
jgi:hypothetical protein